MTKPIAPKPHSMFGRLVAFIFSMIAMFLVAATEGAVEGVVEKKLDEIEEAISELLDAA